jgi:hypothetical protein
MKIGQHVYYAWPHRESTDPKAEILCSVQGPLCVVSFDEATACLTNGGHMFFVARNMVGKTIEEANNLVERWRSAHVAGKTPDNKPTTESRGNQ